MATAQKKPSWTRSPNIEVLYIEKPDGKRGDHLAGGFVKFEYFESLLSPFITAKLRILDTGYSGRATSKTDIQERKGNVSSTLPIAVNDSLDVHLTTETGHLNFSSLTGYSLIVDQFNAHKSVNGKQIVDFNLISKFGLKNRTKKVGRKYQNNIRNSLYSILTNELGIPSSRLNLQETQNSQEFLGSGRSPFELALFLGPKSKPLGGAPGFFFYETVNRFNFKAVNTLVNSVAVATYTAKEVAADDSDPKTNMRILNYNVVKNQDLSAIQDTGILKSNQISFNPKDQGVSGTFFSADSPLIYDDFASLGSENWADFSKDIGTPWYENDVDLGADYSSFKDYKTNFSFLDPGNNSSVKVGVSTSEIFSIVDKANKACSGIGTHINNDPTFIQAVSIMRYNSIFMQVIDMVVPCNLCLIAGAVIKCEFPIMTGDNKSESPNDQWESGNYLILHLSHKFTQDSTRGSLTHLRVVRDTHGLYKSGGS